MLKIAVTGGAGSGKTTVARMFKELGAQVLDADEAARQAVAVGAPAWEELRRTWGPEFFHEDGSLDRAKVAQRVFSDPEARHRLNNLIHPQVTLKIKERLEALEKQGVPLVVVEVPLLFEAGLERAYDRVVVVFAALEDQVSRLEARDHRPEGEIAGILKAQWPLKDKQARADYVVDNRGTLSDTQRQVENIWRELKNHLDRKG
ncbi:MAG: dephospho-CoA kinase [Acidovorax sp.]|nr:dephospho-CoA kinase [Acidovorax sp.]